MIGMTYFLIAIAYLGVSVLVTYTLFSMAGDERRDSSERT